MDKIRFSESEKKIFLMIKDEQSLNHLKGITRASTIAAVQYLEEKGLVTGSTGDRGIAEARLTPKGYAYLEEYPKLDNPIEEEIKNLQLNELKHKEKIRTQESIIRYWKLANIATAVISFIIGIGAVYLLH